MSNVKVKTEMENFEYKTHLVFSQEGLSLLKRLLSEALKYSVKSPRSIIKLMGFINNLSQTSLVIKNKSLLSLLDKEGHVFADVMDNDDNPGLVLRNTLSGEHHHVVFDLNGKMDAFNQVMMIFNGIFKGAFSVLIGKPQTVSVSDVRKKFSSVEDIALMQQTLLSSYSALEKYHEIDQKDIRIIMTDASRSWRTDVMDMRIGLFVEPCDVQFELFDNLLLFMEKEGFVFKNGSEFRFYDIVYEYVNEHHKKYANIPSRIYRDRQDLFFHGLPYGDEKINRNLAVIREKTSSIFNDAVKFVEAYTG